MPNVQNQNLIVVNPGYLNVIRGQQTNVTVTLHKNFVGNPINIGNISNVVAEYIDTNNNIVKTESKSANTLTFGAVNSDAQNQVALFLTGTETAALPLDDSNASGELWVRFKITEGISEVVLPKLKLGNIFDAGDNIGEIVASRFTSPSSVYKVSALGSAAFQANQPAQGQIIFNSDQPNQVTMVKIANKDDKGYRNEYLENLLENRLDIDGLNNSIFFTNVKNNSEYSLYKIVSYNRLNVSNPNNDPNNPVNEMDDAIQLGLLYEGASSTPGDTYTFAIGDEFGIETESYLGVDLQGVKVSATDLLSLIHI